MIGHWANLTYHSSFMLFGLLVIICKVVLIVVSIYLV